MLKILVSQINCFEYPFICPGKNFRLQRNYFYTIWDAYTLRKGKKSIFSIKKILKMGDKINLTLSNTTERNIAPQK